jgi:signal transduction histidine kinase
MQRKFLERVKASTERMGGLLDELINATTLESGGKNLHPTAVDLNAVIDEALASIIANISERNIALRVDLPDDIPQLTADRDALLQILTNLLQNAGMVTPVDGEIWLRARLEIKENEPGYVLLQVTDSGGGIPPEALPRVFSRLYRSDNQSIQGVGDNGVGLAIVKTLVEAHGGRIWVDSEMGRGATYSVLLPLVEDVFETGSIGGSDS